MPSKVKKKKIKRKLKYIDKLFYRIFLSSLLLLLMVAGTKINMTKNIIINSINKQISFTKIAYNFTNIFSNVLEPVGNITVFESLIYDEVKYENGINRVINYSFDGVFNLCDSVVMRIDKKENNLYDVYTVNKDGFSYIYKNLESVDVNIYSYIKSETIIGRSNYDANKKYFKFDLIIEKNNERYNFYEMAED